jgi:hypothetical protein
MGIFGDGGIRAPLTDLAVSAVDARGMNINDDLALFGHRVRQVAIAQDVETAVAIHDNGFHECLSSLRRRLLPL